LKKKSAGPYGRTSILGRSIAGITRMGIDQVQDLGWSSQPAVIYFDDGSLIFPSADPGMNGPGVFFGKNPPKIGGEGFYILGRPEDTRAFYGLAIRHVRLMDPVEMKKEGWDEYGRVQAATVLVFHDGTKIYVSKDEEGNGPGAIFVIRRNRLFFVLSNGDLRLS